MAAKKDVQPELLNFVVISRHLKLEGTAYTKGDPIKLTAKRAESLVNKVILKENMASDVAELEKAKATGKKATADLKKANTELAQVQAELDAMKAAAADKPEDKTEDKTEA